MILAEAGSGKTTELRQQGQAATARGDACFIATVQGIATDGFGEAIGRRGRHQLDQWRTPSAQMLPGNERWCNDGAGRTITVVISSGYIPEQLRSDARAAGVVALMRKERTLDDLAAVVEQALASRDSRWGNLGG